MTPAIQHLAYTDGQIVLFNTHYEQAREALRASLAVLAKATPLNDAKRRASALETQLKSHRYMDVMAERYGWAPRSFAADVERDLAEARRALRELE